jgi:hypothetical protein
VANPKLCFPNWTLPTTIVTPTATGAGWIDLANLQGEVLSEMARYPGVDLAGTRLVIDLGALRNVSVLAIPFHNAGLFDKARIRFCTDAALTDAVIDTDWQDFFGVIYPYGTLDPTRVEWIDGRMTAEDAAGYMIPWTFVTEVAAIGRYLDVQFDWTSNGDGYVDVGQIVAAPSLTSVVNASYGANPPFYNDPSTKSRAKGGPQFADKQRAYRTAKLQFDWLSDDELYSNFFEMARRYGLTQPMFFIYDSDAPAAVRQKQSFMCTASALGPPTSSMFDVNSLPVAVEEAF